MIGIIAALRIKFNSVLGTAKINAFSGVELDLIDNYKDESDYQ